MIVKEQTNCAICGESLNVELDIEELREEDICDACIEKEMEKEI